MSKDEEPSVGQQLLRCDPRVPLALLLFCTNLVSLRLWGDIAVDVKHSSFRLPSLKFLELGYKIVDSEVVFLSGCPKLETLDINFKPENIFLTEAPVPPSSSSKWLKSTNNNFTWSFFTFHTEFRYIQLGIIGNFDSMVEAFLDVFSPSESEYVDPVFDGLLVPDEHILLLLHHSTSKWPLHAPVLNYREFQYLQHLKFILPCFNSNLLVNVLKKCRRLQVLIIQSNMEEPSSFRTWEPLSTTVPICLKSHLTYIRIEGYQGFEDELTFAEYILRNGLVLEKMLIFVDTSMDIMNKYSSVKRLLDIPRGSAKCQLKFDPIVS
ncbi:hypothetical protein P8452_70108 [Trifolium repens]|nr:hypothetical protein P8452_70108 [Trifolium repens]